MKVYIPQNRNSPKSKVPPKKKMKRFKETLQDVVMVLVVVVVVVVVVIVISLTVLKL